MYTLRMVTANVRTRNTITKVAWVYLYLNTRECVVVDWHKSREPEFLVVLLASDVVRHRDDIRGFGV
jgi:hypothetical protein